jgi:hypothetical protein
MSNENQKNHVTASTLLNAAALAQGILNEVLGNDASTMINGVDTNNDADCCELIATAIQASVSEHLG